MNNLFNNCKSMIFAALTLFSATLFGTTTTSPSTILTANSPEEVCTHLDEILALATPEILVLVDVDETLIEEGSDFWSFRETGTFGQMRINKPLVEKLNNLNFLSVFALTSMGTWHMTDIEESLPRMDVDYIAPPTGEAVTRSKVRSNAMRFLGLPFGNTFEHTTRQLPFVTRAVSPSDEIVAALQPVSLSPELAKETLFLDYKILHHTHRLPYGRMQRDLYLQHSNDEKGYEKVIALPICENGVIFSNAFDFDEGWQKGLIVRSFLQATAENPAQRPATIIAIDDNLHMLESIQEACVELGITFYGIHFIPPFRWY